MIMIMVIAKYVFFFCYLVRNPIYVIGILLAFSFSLAIVVHNVADDGYNLYHVIPMVLCRLLSVLLICVLIMFFFFLSFNSYT